MRSPNRRWFAASLAWVVALAGCGNSDEPINQVQPNALSKKMFLNSEWYAHATVIDTDYHSMDFVGDANNLSRIKWDIQEDYLVARRTYEYQRDQEGQAVSGEDHVKGLPVAMYEITSHFDIRRAYNPVTGEEQNVIVENTVDRPWYEREYFRVDWSQNLVKDPMLQINGALGGLEVESMNYFVQDDGEAGQHKEWLPTFVKNDAGEVHYFDLVNKYFTKPSNMTFRNPDGSTTSLPYCLLTFGMMRGADDCAPGEISVRWSFLRVEDYDYQPMVYTSDRMDRFGYFLTHRDGYNRDRGLIRGERLRFNNRHNMWKQSHVRVPRDDSRFQQPGDLFKCRGGQCLVACASNDDCSGLSAGSECDVAYGLAHSTAGACTIPYREREIREIAYHLSENFPAEFETDMLDMVEGWDTAYRKTVAALRRTECETYGGADCGQYTAESTPDVMVMCHNPVQEGDNSACGPVGTVARIGDLRYKQIVWVHEPHVASPLGYGPSFTDPLTGEIINAAANVYGAPLDIYASQAADILAAINGDLPVETIQDNAAYLGWIEDVKSRTFEAKAREAESHVIQLDGHDVQDANASMNFDFYKARMPQFEPATVADFHEKFEASKKAARLLGENLAFGRKGRARMKVLRNTQIEELALDPERRLAAGYLPDQPLYDEDLETVSPFRKGGVRGLKQLNWYRRQLDISRKHCMLGPEFVDAGLIGLVREIDRAVTEGDGTVTWYGVKYDVGKAGQIDYGLVREMVRHPIFHAVMAHEVGHTLGLRHNFSGSFDAVNYKKEYWDLRNDGTMKPRAWDPMTEAEINGRIREYQYSTVMDYGHNFVVTDPHGVGHYDEAAIKMGYGDIVEVFTDVPAANVQRVAQLNGTVPSGVLYNLDPASQNSIQTVPYTEWPNMVGGVDNLQKRKDVRYKDLQVVDNPLLGGGARSLTDDNLPVVPYMYCGDEYRDFNPTCLLYDAGADVYETLQSIIDSYWDYYPFSHFQRQRLSFDSDAVRQRTYGRFLTKLESATRIYSLYRVLLGSALGGDAFFESEKGWGAYTLGVRASYDLLRRIVTTPEPGSHLKKQLADGTEVWEQGFARNIFDLGNAYEVDSFDGRYLRTGFDFGPDFTWLFFDRAGWFHDKDVALQTLVYSDVEFLAQDTTADLREFSTNFYTAFSDSLGPFLGAIVAHDWRAYAPRVRDGEIVYPNPSQIQKRGLDKPSAEVVLDPNLAFSLELVAMSYGAAWIQRAFDQDFMNKARVFVEGGFEGVTLPNTVSFFDERSGLTYIAASYPDDSVPGMEGTTIETGVGAAMINHANALKAAGREAELIDWIDNLNIMRALTGWFGNGASADGILDKL